MEVPDKETLNRLLKDLDPGIQRLIYEMPTNDMPAAELQSILSKSLVDGLRLHGIALGEAAKASDRYAGRLVWATWALVLATAVLVLATFKLG